MNKSDNTEEFLKLLKLLKKKGRDFYRTFNGHTITKVNLRDNLYIENGRGGYQRPKCQRHINKIAARFDLDSVNMPILSFRNGVLYEIDGQHIIEAMIQRGVYQWDCEIIVGIDKEEEARIFYNRGTGAEPLRTWDLYRAAVVAGNEPETTVSQILKRHGLRTPIEAGEKADVTNHAALMAVYRRGGATHLDAFCHVITAVWMIHGRLCPMAQFRCIWSSLSRAMRTRQPDVAEVIAILSQSQNGIEKILKRIHELCALNQNDSRDKWARYVFDKMFSHCKKHARKR